MVTAERVPWMTALAVFCLGSVVFLITRDLFLDHVRDVEVWFGFEVRGAAARWSAPLHWAIFLAGAYGFWFQRAWILPAAAGYSFYVAFCHLIWNLVSARGWGGVAAVGQTILFSIPGVLFTYAQRRRTAEDRP